MPDKQCSISTATGDTCAQVGATITKFDLSAIPEGFMENEAHRASVNVCITQLESQDTNQSIVDKVYNKFCATVKEAMQHQIPHRNIVMKSGSSNKKRRTKKPWWDVIHSDMWNTFCEAENVWISTPPGPNKTQAKAAMKDAQRQFDKAVQSSKRCFWRQQQDNIQELETSDPKAFWQQVKKLGVANERRQVIPWEVLLPDGSASTDKDVVLDTWKQDFAGLLGAETVRCEPEEHQDIPVTHGASLNSDITRDEIVVVLRRAKKGKASGYDGLPVEVLNNSTAITLLHELFNYCFVHNVIPEMWKYGIINPIPKAGNQDPRVPLNYRGITLTSCIYKLFCCILNNRITEWADVNNIIADEQNGFRKKRSCLDHISTRTTIIDSRKKIRKSTFCAYIDFSKAFDHIQRDMLWSKLKHLGLNGNIMNCLVALYHNVKCCVRLNGVLSDWFPVDIGVKQGCILSPLLFSMYINDLTIAVKALNKGVCINDDNVPILLYADDIVLIAETENDLQDMLNLVSDWCLQWKLNINVNKTQVVHYRNVSVPRTDFEFSCGTANLEVVSQYKYLGLIINEFLDYNVSVKHIANQAGRALGSIIAKSKSLGGLPFQCFHKLYDSLVLPILTYGAAIWGYRNYSCINAVYNRACRFYLGVGKYTPNAAVQGDIGWKSPWHQQYICIFRNWRRMCDMPNTKLCNRIFIWAYSLSDTKKNWIFHVKHYFDSIQMSYLSRTDVRYSNTDQNDLDMVLSEIEERKWFEQVNKMESRRPGQGRNKLRTYCLFKSTFNTENYVKCILNRAQRSSFAKFRCGVAPLAIETGRYTNTPLHERL